MQLPYTPLSAETAHIVHFIIEWLAVLVGVQSYRVLKKRYLSKHPDSPQKSGLLSSGSFAVAIGCILGAAIGNKLLFVIESPQTWAEYGVAALAMGQTVAGGMIGGLIGIEVAKKIVGIRYSTGDLFVVPFCVGLMVGRVGCFVAGLHDGTYGIATTLPWGIDFGDGILRHPTQVYDQLCALVMLVVLYFLYPYLKSVAGLSFKLLFMSYMLWRVFVDGLKPVPYEYWLGMSGIQWGCLLATLIYSPIVIRHLKMAIDNNRQSMR